MIGISDMFNMIGVDGCQDVATSLAMQGTVDSISIPIYEVFYLKILAGNDVARISGNLAEYNALRKLNTYCGSVGITINVLDIDLLTLVGAVCVFTPRTGMNVFMKLGDIITDELTHEMLAELAHIAHIPFLGDGSDNHLIVEILQTIFDMIIDRINDNLGDCGINVYNFDELGNYIDEIYNSGEMETMYQYRQMIGAMVF